MSARKISKMLVITFIGMALCSIFAAACSNPVAHISEFNKNDLAGVKPLYGPSADSHYRLVPYDTINVKFPYHPEQEPKTPISILPDGHIALEGIGSIQAVGLTPEQLAKILAEKSSSRMRDPEVVVTVTQYAPRKVYVGGEVKSPGVVQIQDNMTPLQAIFERGGFNLTAQVDSVILIRDANSGNPKIGRIDLYQAMEGAVPEQLALLPNDVLYVPMTGVGRADLWVAQHLRDLIPWELLRAPQYGSFLFK